MKNDLGTKRGVQTPTLISRHHYVQFSGISSIVFRNTPSKRLARIIEISRPFFNSRNAKKYQPFSILFRCKKKARLTSVPGWWKFKQKNIFIALSPVAAHRRSNKIALVSEKDYFFIPFSQTNGKKREKKHGFRIVHGTSSSIVQPTFIMRLGIHPSRYSTRAKAVTDTQPRTEPGKFNPGNEETIGVYSPAPDALTPYIYATLTYRIYTRMARNFLTRKYTRRGTPTGERERVKR